jgi:hypothetical protein
MVTIFATSHRSSQVFELIAGSDLYLKTQLYEKIILTKIFQDYS